MAVVDVADKKISLLHANGEKLELDWANGLSDKRPYLSEDSRGPLPKSAKDFLHVGDVVRVGKDKDGQPRLTQVPEAQSALISLDPLSGAVRALVGGFDFNQSHFNRVTQGARQPGSSFKPLIYTCALENGFTPATMINDAPLVIRNEYTGVIWRPENDEGEYDGPISFRRALYRSKNLVSIRILKSLGVDTVINSLERFGFNKKEFPHELALALGAHALTPMQMATAYAAFANGGYKVDPYLISRIENGQGDVVFEAKPKRVCKTCSDKKFDSNIEETSEPTSTSDEHNAPRIIDARVAYIIDSILKDVVDKGTGVAAKTLGRTDLAGKTGTTNGPRDLWFSGYNPNLITTVWVGIDKNTPLGRREFGSTAALPIWIDFMRTALEGMPNQIVRQPDGIVTVRINTETGKPAQLGDMNTAFEIFSSEVSAVTPSGLGEEAPAETLPEGVL